MASRGEAPDHILLPHEGGSSWVENSYLLAEHPSVAFEVETHKDGMVVLRTTAAEYMPLTIFLTHVEGVLKEDSQAPRYVQVLVHGRSGSDALLPEPQEVMRPVSPVDLQFFGFDQDEMTIVRIASGESGDYVYQIGEGEFGVIFEPGHDIDHAGFGFIANCLNEPDAKQDIAKLVFEQLDQTGSMH